jgi:hypothetical protein
MLRMEAYLNPQEIMKCYDTSQLTVLTALAREFVVCDRPQFVQAFIVSTMRSYRWSRTDSKLDAPHEGVADLPADQRT